MAYYLFVNFKTYEDGTGPKALALSKLLSSFSSTGVEIVPVVQAVDIKEIAQSCALKVFAQHADAIEYGSHTGKVLPEALRQAGASGTVLNHAENKISNESIAATIVRCRKVGLKVMVCAENTKRAQEIAKFSPDFLAVEPPELIGGDVSVSTAQPELISKSVEAIHKIDKKIKVITGAGIKNASDVSKAIELGTLGVFVASGVVMAKDKEFTVRNLLLGFPEKDSDKLEP